MSALPCYVLVSGFGQALSLSVSICKRGLISELTAWALKNINRY